MITPSEEYLQNLWKIQTELRTEVIANLPSKEQIYEIDLNSRKILSPKILSAKHDHNAEILYFKMDRYHDNQDLAKTVGIVQYENKNARKEDGSRYGGYLYSIPFFDTKTFAGENKIVFPWAIGGPATMAAGPLEFAFRFYLLDKNENTDEVSLLYSLNTIPATGEILNGMDSVLTDENGNIIPDVTIAEELIQRLNDIKNNATIQWIDASNPNI